KRLTVSILLGQKLASRWSPLTRWPPMGPLLVAAGFTPVSMPMGSTTRLNGCRAMSKMRWPTSGLGLGLPIGEYYITVHPQIWTVTPGRIAQDSCGGMRTRADGQAVTFLISQWIVPPQARPTTIKWAQRHWPEMIHSLCKPMEKAGSSRQTV